MKAAYLDYAASNPIDPRVREAVLFALDAFGNPSSVHAQGRAVREAIDAARESVAGLLGVGPGSIVFTSGATEANNLAIAGFFRRLKETLPAEKGMRLLVSAIEHPSVREAVKRVQVECGIAVGIVPVDQDGVVRVDRLREMMSDDVVMVCVMWANNIIGSLQPIGDIAAVVRDERARRGAGGLPIVLMSDAVQALRTEDVRPAEAGVDLLSLSGHKIYGPKGVGALYVREGMELAPLVVGGGQESGLRGGTENVPGIIGLGRAAAILSVDRGKDRGHAARLQAALIAGLRTLGRITIFGDPSRSVPGILYFAAAGEQGDVLALKLDAAGVAVSSGSACEAGTRKAASVLQEICSGPSAKNGGVRVSMGRSSSDEDIARLLEVLIDLKVR